MADEASTTPPEKPPQKKAEEPAPPAMEQPQPSPPSTTDDEEVAAEQSAEAPEAPTLPKVAAAGTAKEGAGLFFPDAAKIRERAAKKAPASDTPKPAPAKAPPQQDTPAAAAKETDEEAEAEEAEEVTVHRPPPAPTPDARLPPPRPPQKTKKKTGIGHSNNISGYLVETSKDGKQSFALVVNGLSKKDYEYLTFMCGYLADPARQYIPIAHPTYLIKFSLNFVLQAIKEELEENKRELERV
jgi:hypothetical protein